VNSLAFSPFSESTNYCFLVVTMPLPSDRQYMRIIDDCLEDNKEDCQDCSVLYCVLQLYPVICTLI